MLSQTCEACRGQASNCLVLTWRLGQEHGNTRTNRSRDAQTLDLSVLNDSIEAVTSSLDSTAIHSGFAGVVCWQEAQLRGCQSMCQEKASPSMKLS